MYKVYIQPDAQSRITAINSDAFITNTTDWIQIDEGDGDRFHHAQGNYFDKPLMTMQGVYQYKLVKGKVIERTTVEIAADVALTPKPAPSAEDRIKALEAELAAIKPTVATLTRDITALQAVKRI